MLLCEYLWGYTCGFFLMRRPTMLVHLYVLTYGLLCPKTIDLLSACFISRFLRTFSYYVVLSSFKSFGATAPKLPRTSEMCRGRTSHCRAWLGFWHDNLWFFAGIWTQMFGADTKFVTFTTLTPKSGHSFRKTTPICWIASANPRS